VRKQYRRTFNRWEHFRAHVILQIGIFESEGVLDGTRAQLLRDAVYTVDESFNIEKASEAAP
jgi:hypothetical protein